MQIENQNNQRIKHREQWHPPFYASYKIDFRAYKDVLTIEEAHILSRSNEIDILVTKKDPDAVIDNGIGRAYKAHNLIEYKSPNDRIDRDALLQLAGYICIYMRMEKLRADEVLACFVGYHYPKSVIDWLKSIGYDYRQTESGVYLLHHELLVDVQFVLIHKLDVQSYPWISAIQKNITDKNVRCVGSQIKNLDLPEYRELAEEVTDLITRQEKGKGDELFMHETRMLFKQEFDKLAQLETEIKTKDETIKTKDETIKSKDEENAKLREENRQKDNTLKKLESELAKRGIQIASLL